MCVKNLDKRLLLLCLAFFCVTEKTTKNTILQPRNKLKPGKNPNGKSTAGGCPCLSSAFRGLHLETAAVPEQTRTLTGLHDRWVRIQGKFWLTTMQTWCPISWPGPCSSAAWELLVFAGRTVCLSHLELIASWRKSFYHPTPSNIQVSNTCLKFFLAKKYHCCPMFSGMILCWRKNILRMSLNSYFVLSWEDGKVPAPNVCFLWASLFSMFQGHSFYSYLSLKKAQAVSSNVSFKEYLALWTSSLFFWIFPLFSLMEQPK